MSLYRILRTEIRARRAVLEKVVDISNSKAAAADHAGINKRLPATTKPPKKLPEITRVLTRLQSL